MITSDYLKVMARYNHWQNREICAAASRLSDPARREDRGAFFGSIHATLSHLYWADQIWMSRLELIEAPRVSARESANYIDDFEHLYDLRYALDKKLIDFADGSEAGPVKGSLTWFSGSVGRESTAPLSMLLVHMFNHQTHHRGQVHAMLTAAGESTSDTDLFLMPASLWPERN